jgi:hypothetical protein
MNSFNQNYADRRAFFKQAAVLSLSTSVSGLIGEHPKMAYDTDDPMIEMAQYANQIVQKKGLGISFQTLVPMQMIAETNLAQTVAGAYAKLQGLTVEEFVEARYGEPLTAVEFAKLTHTFLTDPEYLEGAAYGIRKDTGLKLFDYSSPFL